MRKIFFLIPALIISMMVNATVTYITPTSYSSTPLNQAVGAANPNDTLVLAEGTYVETNGDGYIAFDKNLVVKAEDNANVIVDLRVPMTISNGTRAEIIGITFDATNLRKDADWYEHMIQVADDSDNNRLFFDGCEFYNDTINSAAIYCASDKKLDSLCITNCKFHDITKSCVYLENAGLVNLTITNSTFANIARGATNSYWASNVYVKSATAANILVDHCTFYNVQTMNTDYGAIKVSPSIAPVVSNCVFMMPESYSGGRAVYNTDGVVTNCLTYNYAKDSAPAHGIHSGPTITNCFEGDPLFTDAANGDFSFVNNNWVTMNLSPACGAATDGMDLGDPLWHTTVPVLPSVDFTTAYNLIGTKAQLTGNIRLNSNNNIEYFDNAVAGIATWQIHVTKACAIQATIDMEAGTTSGNKFRVYAYDTKGNAVDSVVNGYNEKSDADINVPGSIYFPKAGDYMVRLYNAQSHSSAKVEKIILSYAGGNVQNIPATLAVDDAWFGNGGTRANGQITFSSWKNDNSWIKWNAATTKDVFCTVKTTVSTTNGHNMTVAIYEDETAEPIATLSEGGQKEDIGTQFDINLGRVYLAGGKNYVVKVTNPISGSVIKVDGVKFEEVVIPTIPIAGTLNPADAMLSERAWVDTEGTVDSLLFTARGDEAYNSSQWAKWKISAASHGYYKFTLNAYTGAPAKSQRYILTILSNDESKVIATKTTAWDNTNNEYADFVCAELEQGNYIVKVENPEWGSTGRVLNIVATYDGGAFTEIPTNSLLGAEAMLHATKMTRDDNNDIQYNDNGNPTDEYVMWNIHVTNPDEMEVSFNVLSGGHQFSLELYKAGVLVGSAAEPEASWDADVKLNNHLTFSEAGNYQLKLINTQANSGGLLHSITFAPYVAPEPVVIDENATENGEWATYLDGDPIDLSISRTLKGGVYNTICLPFELGSTGSMSAAFGAGYELLRLKEATLEGGVLNLIFEEKETMESGVPYLIKPVADVENPNFTSRKIKKTTASTETKGNVQFIGTFVKQTIDQDEHNLYLGNDNSLYFVNNDVTIKGMRAYFHLNIQNPQQVIRRAQIVAGSQVVTSVDFVKDANNATFKTIENGQLVIIRDGIRYNVMGVKIQ